MGAVVIATLVASAAGVAAWLVDQRLLRCRTALRAAVATALAVVSTWIAVLIQSALWLRVPGAYGPVQYWHNDPGATDFMMSTRVGAMYLLLAGVGLATITVLFTAVSLFLPTKHNCGNRLVVPIAALAVFALAWFWFDYYEFFPSA